MVASKWRSMVLGLRGDGELMVAQPSRAAAGGVGVWWLSASVELLVVCCWREMWLRVVAWWRSWEMVVSSSMVKLGSYGGESFSGDVAGRG